jgi:hypothetical protein
MVTYSLHIHALKFCYQIRQYFGGFGGGVTNNIFLL